MDFPEISIITVSYNSYSTIERTIQSVIDQSYPNKEFIIIDGNSNDGTVDIIKKYRNEVNVFISEPDNGIPHALNKGIHLAKGEWLYFLSSDDILFDNQVLERIAKHLEGCEGLVYGDVVMKSTGKVFGGEYDIKKTITTNICHQAQFYNKNIFSKIGNYNTKYKLLSDYDHTLRIFRDLTIEKKYINEKIAVFNDMGRTSFLVDKCFWKDRREIFLKRFKGVLPVSYSVRGFESYFYYLSKNGMAIKSIYPMLQLTLFTKTIGYFSFFVKQLFYKFK